MKATLRVRLIAPVAALLAVGMAVSGCGADADTNHPVAIAVVVGQRADSAPIGPSPLLTTLAQSWVARQAQLTFITSDGVPDVVRNLSLSVSAPNALYAQQEDKAVQAQTISDLIASRATTAQADPLDAITLAARSVVQSNGAKEVYIFDSGLQTTAPLAFQYGLLGETPSMIVSFLKANHELPDLTGISVMWNGLGDTAPPQAPLTTASYERLEAIWSAILRASGAAQVTIEEEPLPLAADPHGLPPVTPVPVQGIGNPSPPPTMVVTLNPTSVDFIANEATYFNASHARGVLESVAAAIREGGYSRVTLTGTCALPCAGLSLERANAVAATLETYGLPAGEITTNGVGPDFPGFVPDVLPDGTLDSVAAEQDRLVIVTATQ